MEKQLGQPTARKAMKRDGTAMQKAVQAIKERMDRYEHPFMDKVLVPSGERGEKTKATDAELRGE